MKKISLISTGSELLHGKIIDSNNAYISGRFFSTDFRVIMHFTVGDNVDYLRIAVQNALEISDIVIITGGLGPTDDDYTLEVLKDLFNFSTVINMDAKNKMELFFKSMGRHIVPGDLKMATVPENSILFENELGLATGYCIFINEKAIIALPGVPREMTRMFDNEVMPYLLKRYSVQKCESLDLKIILMREAEVNNAIKGMNIPFGSLDWGITAQTGMNKVSFIQTNNESFLIDIIRSEAKRVFGNRMLSEGSASLEAEIVALLKEKCLTIAIAESCTGGLIAKRLTDIPGSSEVFPGGIVSYSNEIKKKLLDVPAQVLDNYGAVSEEVAAEMALGVKKQFNSDIAISATGIAGPGGATPDKPVGMVCFGMCTNEKAETFTELIPGDRERIRYLASQHILNRVRLYLKA